MGGDRAIRLNRDSRYRWERPQSGRRFCFLWVVLSVLLVGRAAYGITPEETLAISERFANRLFCETLTITGVTVNIDDTLLSVTRGAESEPSVFVDLVLLSEAENENFRTRNFAGRIRDPQLRLSEAERQCLVRFLKQQDTTDLDLETAPVPVVGKATDHPFTFLHLPNLSQRIGYYLLALIVAVILLRRFIAAKGWRSPDFILRDPRWIGLMALFVFLAVLVPDVMPVHEHNSYLSRSDCAYDWTSHSLRPWGLATYSLYGLALHLVPYRVGVLGYLCLAFSVASLLLMGAFLRRLFTEFGHAGAGAWIAWLAAAFCVVHPAFLRMSVAATFFPYTMCLLFGAGIAGLDTRRDARFWMAFAALILLAFAAMGIWVQLVWLPLAVIAPFCWRPAPLRPPQKRALFGYLGALALFGLFVLPYTMEVARILFGFGGHGVGPEINEWWPFTLIYSRFNLTPAPLVVLYWLGVSVSALALLYGKWFLLPILYAFAASETFLGSQVTLFTGYPTRFIHGFVSMYFSAIFAALGLYALLNFLKPKTRVAVTGLVLALSVALIPTARDSVDFLTKERMMNVELRGISEAIGHLPQHRTFIQASALFGFLDCAHPDTDPVEVHFPREEYKTRMQDRYGANPQWVALDAFLDDPSLADPASSLVYIGSSLQSFVPCEIREKRVPKSLERPLLQRLKARYRLEPVFVFEVPTRQHVAVSARLAADRKESVEFGFYRLHPRRHETERQE